MNGLCKDCKFWYRGECNDATEIKPLDDPGEASLSYYGDASDDQGLTYGIKTGPYFGCIHFSPKHKDS